MMEETGQEVGFQLYDFFTSKWGIVLLFNALLGCCCLEWAWHKTLRFRKPNHELNTQFNLFARFDAPLWKKWQFYPGALTVLLPRLVIGVLIAVISIIFVNLLLIG